MKKSIKSLIMVGLSLFIGFGLVGCGGDTETYTSSSTEQKNDPDLKAAHELFVSSMEEEVGGLLQGMTVESRGNTVIVRQQFAAADIEYDLMYGLWNADVQTWRDASEPWRMAFDAYGYTSINYVVELYVAETDEIILRCENGYVTYDAFMETDTF